MEIVLAQALPFDPGSWAVFGPMGAVAGGLLWYLGKLQAKIDKMNEEHDKTVAAMITVHKTEIAAERALNAQLQDKRIEDHRVLIPLTTNVVTVLEMQMESKK